MRFLTEYELSDRYRHHQLDALVLEPGTRLTPEAQQFLTDHRIPVQRLQAAAKPAAKKAPAKPKSTAAATDPALWQWVRLRLMEVATACQSVDLELCQQLLDLSQQPEPTRPTPDSAVTLESFNLSPVFALQPHGQVMLALARLGTELLLIQKQTESTELRGVTQAVAQVLSRLKSKEE